MSSPPLRPVVAPGGAEHVVEELRRLRRVATLAASGRPLRELLSELVASVTSAAGASMGSIELAPDEQSLCDDVFVGISDASLRHVKALRSGSLDPCGRLDAGPRDLVVVSDTDTDPRCIEYRRGAHQVGIRALYSVPLARPDGRAMGALTTYFDSPHVPGEVEIERARLHALLALSVLERERARRAAASDVAPAGGLDDAKGAPTLRERDDEELTRITNAVPALISYVGADYRYKLANRTYERWFHQPADAIRGRHVCEVLGEAAWNALRPYMERALAGEEVTYEDEVPYRDVGSRWVSVIYRPDLDASGRAKGFAVLVNDITARKIAERERAAQALLEKGERLRAALEASATGTFRWNIRTGELSCDEPLERLFGLPPGVTIRSLDAFLERVHPDERQGVVDACNRCKDEGADFEMQYRVVHPDGSTHWLSDRGKTLLGDDGEPSYMTGACVDITAQKRAEAEVRAARAHLQCVMDTLPAYVAHCDTQHRFVWVNRSYAQRFGRPAHEIAGLPISAIVGDELYAAVRPHIDRVLGGEPVDFEIEFTSSPLRGRWMHVVYAPTFDGAGTPDGWVSVIQDISPRKELERALRRAVEKLEQTDRRKDEFLAMLAHELRNPLGPIRNGVHLLERLAPPDARIGQIRDIIDRQSSHMSRLVDDLLDVSRIARGKIVLQREDIDLAKLARDVADDYRSTFEAKGVGLSVHGPAGPVWVRGDRTRLAQAVGNLLHNAIKFSNANGEAAVRVKADGDAAVLVVEDDGVGIAADVLPTLFEPFAQGRQALDRSGGGLGLGLALVKGLADLHGGSVDAHSDGVGRGARFMLRLPLARTTQAVRPSDGAAAPVTARKILIVEDNADAAESLEMLLSISGHEVRVASDARQALDIAQTWSPDIVICDIGLPEMDGYTLCRRLRQRLPAKGALFIALTGYGQVEDVQRALDAGFDQHFTKPFDPDELEAIIAGTC